MKIDFKNRKTIIVIVVCIVILILISASIFLISNNNKESKMLKLYKQLQESQQYSFVLRENDGYIINMAKRGNDTSIDMQSEDMHTTTLIKDEKAYFINHDEKLYSSYDETAANENILFDELERISEIKPVKGKEKIKGKTYKYEEYSGYSGFMYSSNIDIEEENVKTRFYFIGDELKYIKTIISEGEEELIEVELTYSTDDYLFEIPSKYTEMQ